MVEEIGKAGKNLYVCVVCGLAYEQEEWAERCQKWCLQHKGCNLEVIQHAVSLDD